MTGFIICGFFSNVEWEMMVFERCVLRGNVRSRGPFHQILNPPTPIHTVPPSIRGRNRLIFLSGPGGEHKNETLLSTTGIIFAICGENKKPGKLTGDIFSL
jgi:hypothetical protein